MKVTKTAQKKVVFTDQAPKPIGPYSQAVRAGSFLFCSGQIPLDLAGNIVGQDVAAQTHQVMKNVEALLNAEQCGFESVVKTTIFLKSMADFPHVNEIYGEYFKSSHPARSTIEVSRLPKDVLVEIEVIAILHAE